MYADMHPWRQLESVAHSRWCGAYWQSKGLTVVPTISWSTPSSYRYCFDGVEEGAIVAVGMIGCKSNKFGFMHGYNAMLEKIHPEAVICFGTPFPEMKGNLINVDYCASRKVGEVIWGAVGRLQLEITFLTVMKLLEQLMELKYCRELQGSTDYLKKAHSECCLYQAQARRNIP